MKRLGLVLSGGGAYGAFQAGVIDVLYQHGITFKMIAGTSIGALNGVLASSGNSEELKNLWTRMPKTLERQLMLAKPQWRACLEVFESIEGDAKRYVEDQARATWNPFERYRISKNRVSIGRRFALRKLNEKIRQMEEAGPIIPISAIDILRESLDRVRSKAKVLVTLTDRDRIEGRHLIQMQGGNFEVVNNGLYQEVDRQSQVDLAIASMAIPLLVGARNEVNRTKYLDGGLTDNLPIAALSDQVRTGNLQGIVVIDVSSNAQYLAENFRKELSEGVYFYIGLSRNSRLDALLNFDRAKSLFEKGQSAGRDAIKQWFSYEDQLLVDEWNNSQAVLPKDFVIRRSA